jgi:hypothetical protein
MEEEIEEGGGVGYRGIEFGWSPPRTEAGSSSLGCGSAAYSQPSAFGPPVSKGAGAYSRTS